MKARAETILRDRLELGPVLGLQPRRLAVLVTSVSLSVFLALTVWTFSMALEAYQRRSDAAMVELALALASQVDIDAHERLVSDGQTGSEDYKRLLVPLEQMHLEMHEVRGVYTKRIDAGGDMVYVLDTAQSDRSGRLASLLRHNALTRYANPPAQNELHDTPAPTTVETAAGAPRRRNILS